MTTYQPIINLVARIFLGALFLISGLGKLGDVAGFAGYLAYGGLPAFLAWPAILFEIFGGLAIIIGFQTRIAALALAGFSLLAGVLYHFAPADQMQMIMFWKNIGLAGGFLLLAAYGAGKLSVDSKLAR